MCVYFYQNIDKILFIKINKNTLNINLKLILFSNIKNIKSGSFYIDFVLVLVFVKKGVFVLDISFVIGTHICWTY